MAALAGALIVVGGHVVQFYPAVETLGGEILASRYVRSQYGEDGGFQLQEKATTALDRF
jgi:hypothetical protein